MCLWHSSIVSVYVRIINLDQVKMINLYQFLTIEVFKSLSFVFLNM